VLTFVFRFFSYHCGSIFDPVKEKFHMKKLIAAALLFASFSFTITGDGDKIPSATLKKLDGSKVNSNTFSNDGKPMIISFWATWCKPCIAELNAIHESYPDWVKETGVKLIAISIDDARSVAKVVPFVKTKGWQYEVYTDENQDFKRVMNVNNPPQTFLIDAKGNIVWSHTGYSEGDEEKLFENVKKLAAGQAVSH
jgi:cytochrome c biogenesis protein CcmG/thiol:disulfide interchange protein DsbE